MKLLKGQRNQLFEEIEKINLPPASFTMSSDVFFLRFNSPEKYYFIANELSHPNFAQLDFSPGQNKLVEKVYAKTWNELIQLFSFWLSYLKREITTIDKWSFLSEELKNLNLIENQDFAKFTYEEFVQIENKINRLKESLPKLIVEKDKIDTLNSNLNHLIEQAKHNSKYDWRNLFIGTVISVIIQLTLSQEQGKELWDLIKNIFTNYFYLN